MKQSLIQLNSKNIPLFALYGEEPWVDDPGFIHCEDIASRSSALGWEIKPHRHSQLYQCLIVEKGKTVAVLDDSQVEFAKRCVLWIPPGVVHSFQFAAGTRGCVVSFADRILLGDEKNYLRDFIGDLSATFKTWDLSTRQDNPLYEKVLAVVALLQSEMQTSEHGKNLYCEALLQQLLILLRRFHLQQDSIDKPAEQDLLMQAFKRELDKHFKDHWHIADYAQQLNVTSSRLARLIRRHAGVGAKEIIQRRLLIESKRKLLYTRQTADEIAFELGFKDPAYFSRFFKKFTSLSPGKFREMNRF